MSSSFFETIQAPQRAKEREPLWLIAYIDLTTNLMAIFILMFAMSKVDQSKFDAVASKVTRQRTDSLDELKSKIDAEIKAKKLGGQVATDLGMFGLNVEFNGGVLFNSASADLSPFARKEAQPILDILSKTDVKYLLSLEGHTDDVPIKGGKFLNNWGLSSARGVSLLDELKRHGVNEKRMSVAGFADTRPMVAVAGKTGTELEQARARNRRVVIRVYQ